jgi:hypothetical protein
MQPPEGAQFVGEDRMRAGRALLDPADVQGGSQCRVPVAVAVVLGGLDQPLTSVSVRCSRVRRSLLGGRFGATVRFTVVGVTNRRRALAMYFGLLVSMTVRRRCSTRLSTGSVALRGPCHHGNLTGFVCSYHWRAASGEADGPAHRSLSGRRSSA